MSRRVICARSGYRQQLVAALDPHDYVGVMDSYFPRPNSSPSSNGSTANRQGAAAGRGDRLYLDLFAQLISTTPISGLRCAAVRDAICEKPLVLNPWNIDALAEIEAESEHRINTILQLRLHPTILALPKQRVESQPANDASTST